MRGEEKKVCEEMSFKIHMYIQLCISVTVVVVEIKKEQKISLIVLLNNDIF